MSPGKRHMSTLPGLRSLRKFAGKRVLVRAGLNVPVDGQRVTDDYRLRRIWPTIQLLKDAGSRVVMVGHIGRGPKDTLSPVADHLNKHMRTKVRFVPEVTGGRVIDEVAGMSNGDVLLLENLRQNPGEQANDRSFAAALAQIADLYVNEAFSVAHRKHASVHAITRYLPSYAGPLFVDEVKHLSEVLVPQHPFFFVLGGAKIATKMPLLKKFVDLADVLFVGGALAHDIMVARDMEIGRSLHGEKVRGVKRLANNPKLLIPEDVVVEGRHGVEALETDAVRKSDRILDAGPRSQKVFADILAGSRLIVVNGPLGYYEGGYTEGTKALLRAVANSGARTIIGGGDTVACARAMKLEGKFTFVSTGGGAMLDYLADGNLPAIEALIKSKRS